MLSVAQTLSLLSRDSPRLFKVGNERTPVFRVLPKIGFSLGGRVSRPAPDVYVRLWQRRGKVVAIFIDGNERSSLMPVSFRKTVSG